MVMLIHRITEDAGTLAIDTCLVDSFPDSTDAERSKAYEVANGVRKKLIGRKALGDIVGGER